jgi:hypothetical protein
LSSARSEGDKYRIRTAKQMLQASDRAICEVRGVSEWISESVTLRMLDYLAGEGYTVLN